MIHFLTAYTCEVDISGDAINEILHQLDRQHKLLKNTVGILFCNYEFIETGVAQAICQSLPFDIIGCTTQTFSFKESQGDFMLVLSVLTSDDVMFSTAYSESLDHNTEQNIINTYHHALPTIAGDPSLIMAFQPLIPQFLSGDQLIHTLDKITGGLPIFGSVALDFTTNFRAPQTIYNGTASDNRLALLLISGNIKPKFYVESMSEDYIIYENAIITESDGNKLISLNHIPAVKFFESIGLAPNEFFNGTQISLAIKIDYHDSTKSKACMMHSITPDGAILCGGEVPAGASLTIGTLIHDDVIKTTSQLLTSLEQPADCNALFLCSCFGRNMVLSNNWAELNVVRDHIKNIDIPYIYFSSAGEFCPLYLSDHSKTINRFHNNSIVACML